MTNTPYPQPGYGHQYIDKWHQLWIRLDAYTVWKPDTGYGTWDNGNGLWLLND